MLRTLYNMDGTSLCSQSPPLHKLNWSVMQRSACQRVKVDKNIFDNGWAQRSSCQRVDVEKKFIMVELKEVHVKEYPGHVQKILFVGVELLDNKIVQPIKVCIFHIFLGLNYFIIQEFNPNKKYFFVHVLGWTFG